MTLGTLAIRLSAVCAVIAFIAAVRWARGRAASERTFRWAYHGMTGSLAVAAVLLMTAILRHDFRFEYVIGYSSRDLPLIYLISAFWAGQAGTYLLWGLLGALAGYALFRRDAWQAPTVMAFWVPTVGFLHLLMLDPNGNPFRLAAGVPADGNGLNPLLQDPWMASHPPLVFLGYVAMTVPAVLALAALARREADEWLAPALRWSLVAFVTLGAGIVLGGFWAYKVLGWGGYWGWDPVENASLVPWLVVTALLHGLVVQKASGALPRTNLALALAGYVLVFYATFLTRSGVLADFSVHSFPAGSIFRVLLGIQLVILAGSVVAFVRGMRLAGREIPLELSWPLVLSAAIGLLGISAALVLVGTSWPILSSLTGRPSTFGPAWYNSVSLPVYLVVLVLLGLAPLLGWGPRPWSTLRRRLVPALAAGAAAVGLAFIAGATGGRALVLLFACVFALASNVIRLAELGRVRLLAVGAPVAHVGFALMFVGVAASSFWSESREVRLPLGQPVDALGRTLTFLGHVEGSAPQDRWRVDVREPGRVPVTAEVAMFRTGPRPDASVMHRPAILRGLAGDLYLAPAGLDLGVRHETLDLDRGRPTPVGRSVVTFLGFETQGMGSPEGLTVLSRVRIEGGGEEETVALPFTMAGGRTEAAVVEARAGGEIRSLQVQRISVEQSRVTVQADVQDGAGAWTLAGEVSYKPLMSLLWAGTLLLGTGCGIAWLRRRADARALAGARPAPAAEPAPRREKRGRRLPPRPAVARR